MFLHDIRVCRRVSIEWLEHVSPGFSSGTLAKGGLEIDSHHRMALSTTLDAVKSESIMRSAEHGSGIMVSRF